MEHLETRPKFTAALKAHGRENVLKQINARLVVSLFGKFVTLRATYIMELIRIYDFTINKERLTDCLNNYIVI